MSASITVDIQAKISGWRQQLEKIKEAANKVDLGTSFGRSLEREIKKVESQVNTMSRSISRRLVSESGIESFTNQMDNVDTAIKNIGESIGKISFDQLKPEYVTEELKKLNQELDDARAKLAETSQADFTEQAKSIDSIRISLKRMGEDIETISMEDAFAKMSQAAKDYGKKLEEDEAKVQKLRERKNLKQRKEHIKEIIRF